MKRLSQILLILVVVLVAVRVTLPVVVRHQVNNKLAALPDYRGHVDDVDLALWRGAVSLQDLTVEHKVGDFALTIKDLDVNISWPDLVKKHLVADVTVESPRARILVEKPSKAAREAKEKAKDVQKDVEAKTGKSLPDLLAGMMPFDVREFRINDGTVRIQEKAGQDLQQEQARDKDKSEEENKAKEKELEARATNIDVVVRNVTNSASLTGSPNATGKVTAQIMDEGRLKMDLKMNPVAEQPQFDLNMDMTRVDLTELNPLLRWQMGMDVTRGTFAMFMEAAAKGGQFKGYVKPFVHDLKMLGSKADKKNFGTKVKEAVVGAVATVLKNQKTENVAAKVPFEGRFDDPQVGIWQAVATVLRNGFIRALQPRLDQTVRVGDLKGGSHHG
jgi:hypothetical protein